MKGAGGIQQFTKGFVKEAFDIVQEKGGICIHDEVHIHFQNIIHTFIVKKLNGLSLFGDSTKKENTKKRRISLW